MNARMRFCQKQTKVLCDVKISWICNDFVIQKVFLEATMFSEIGYIAFLLLALPYIESGEYPPLSSYLVFVRPPHKKQLAVSARFRLWRRYAFSVIFIFSIHKCLIWLAKQMYQNISKNISKNKTTYKLL